MYKQFLIHNLIQTFNTQIIPIFIQITKTLNKKISVIQIIKIIRLLIIIYLTKIVQYNQFQTKSINHSVQPTLNNIRVEQSINKDINIQENYKQQTPQRQFNRLALSLLGIKRTKLNRTCLSNRSRLNIGQISNKNHRQTNLLIKVESRYNNRQLNKKQIYQDRDYPYPAQKIQNIKEEINKLSQMSKIRRSSVKNQRIQFNNKVNNQKYYQEQNLDKSSNPKNIYSQICKNKKNQSSKKYTITIKTSLTRIKNFIHQHKYLKSLQIQVPQFFIKPPSQLSSYSSTSSFNTQVLTNQIIHIFSNLNIPIIKISIRKYSNCIVIVNQNLCIIWHQGTQGKKYIGSWAEKYFDVGYKEGIGLEWLPCKYIYYGQFKDNKRNGFGVMKLSNRNIVIGDWRHGKHMQI